MSEGKASSSRGSSGSKSGSKSSSSRPKKQWLPLESNPEVVNKYLGKLGVSSKFGFSDIYGTDPELLAFVPQPCYGVVALFPISDNYEKARAEEEAHIKAKGQAAISPKLWFTKQTVGNACGTVAILHTLANTGKLIGLSDDTPVGRFFAKTRPMNADDKAQALEDDTEISTAHSSAGQEGQTAAPDLGERVDMHFVALVHLDGGLYELDGRKPFPIHHGPTTEGTLLGDAVGVIKKFMARDPTELRFTMMSFGAVQD